MIMWSGFHQDGKIPIIIECIYDKDRGTYTVEVTRGFDTLEDEFIPNKKPKDNLMHISDLEFSVKAANQLLKELKKMAHRKKK